MGGSTSKKIEYGVFTGEKKEGETQILRHPSVVGKELTKIGEIDTIWKAFEHAVKAKGEARYLGTRKTLSKDKFGDYEWKTYKQIYDLVRDFAAGMAILNFCPQLESQIDGKFKFLGMYAKNREEWVVADLASHLNGVSVVTFYDTLGENTIEFILNQTRLTSLVMESKSLKKMIHLKKEGQSGCLENIILVDVEDESLVKAAEEAGYKIYKYEDVIATGKGKEVEFTPSTRETIATFCYTSGTTGVPKGAMISHEILMTDVQAVDYAEANLSENDVIISYLPMAHILERLIFTACTYKNMSVGFYSGNPAKLTEDAQLLKPTVFVGVPRIYQRVYEVITGNMAKLGYVKKALADRAVAAKLDAYRKNGKLSHSIWDRLVFNKTKAALGGRVRIMVSGSAPIAPDMLEFLRICFGCPILEGYGATETCGCACITQIDDFSLGHVGGPFGYVETKLIDCEALNYKSTDVDQDGNPFPRGEVCFRGNIIFKGYFNDKDNTKAAIDSDGWLHTGDVGAFLPAQGNALKIIDRVKNIFKLSFGEYVAPEKLENILIKSKYVAQIFIHGESIENFLVAVVVPKKEAVVEFLNSISVTCTKENVHEYFDNKELVKDVLKDMEALGRRCDFKGFEVVKRCVLVNEPFTVDNNLLTPTMKLKRGDAKAKYTEEIKAMYSEK